MKNATKLSAAIILLSTGFLSAQNKYDDDIYYSAKDKKNIPTPVKTITPTPNNNANDNKNYTNQEIQEVNRRKISKWPDGLLIVKIDNSQLVAV